MDNFKQKEMTVAQMEDWLNKEDFEELIKVIALMDLQAMQLY